MLLGPGRLALAAALLLLASWGSGRAPRPSALPAPAPASAFSSRASCQQLLRAQQRLARTPGSARFASWNLHWFPDGGPGESREPESGADLGWLSCALWWLDADVVAVQEVKQTPRAEQALARVLAELNRLSGARYVARLDDCGSRVPQHVGLIWNEARVTARELETVAELNPAGGACEHQLRPGLAARLRLPGGLDLTAVSAHFKSMTDERAFQLRARSFAAIAGLAAARSARAHDADFLLLGDLNTMGCTTCSPPLAARDEVAGVRQRLAVAGLRLVPADAAGSQLYAGGVALLDHAVASSTMQELGPAVRSHVVGACAAAAPSRRAARRIRRGLSDHCPIVLDLSDRDLD